MSLIPFLLVGSLMQPITVPPGPLSWQNHYRDPHVIPLLIYFNSENCHSCAQFDSLFERPEILQKLEVSYVPVRVNINTLAGKACADIYNVNTTPAVVVADPQGVILYKSDETLTIQEIEKLLEHVPGNFSEVVSNVEAVENSTAVNHCITGTGAQVDVVEKEKMISESNPALHTSHDSEAIHATIVTQEMNVKPETVEEKKYDDSIAHEPKALKTALTTETHLASVPEQGESREQTSQTTQHIGTKPKIPTTKTTRQPTTIQRTYAIQLGFFSVANNANALMQKAILKGLSETRTETEQHNGLPSYRVLVGKCSTLTEAQELLADVHELGFKGAVYRQ